MIQRGKKIQMIERLRKSRERQFEKGNAHGTRCLSMSKRERIEVRERELKF